MTMNSDRPVGGSSGGHQVRILHIITRLILGGAQENTLYTVIGQQQHPDFRVTLLVGVDDGTEGSLEEKARAEGVDLMILPSLIRPIRPWTDVWATWQLYRLMKAGRYDIVHTHSSKAGIVGRVAARLAGVPIVVHTLHSLVFHEYQSAWKNRLYILLKRFCAPMTDVLISVNDMTTQGALAAGIGHPKQYVTVHSGFELDRFVDVGRQISITSAKERLGIPSEAPVVGKIARLFAQKGHDQFFEVASRIAQHNPEVRFLLVGDGPLRGALEERARTLNLDDRVVFVGRVPPDDVPAHIQAMDVVVHTSLREGIARVIPQAGAVGKSVVTFELDGAPEVIQDGVSGYLVPPMDVEALADRTIDLLESPALRSQFGQAGQERAISMFKIETMVNKINDIYQSLLVEHRKTVSSL